MLAREENPIVEGETLSHLKKHPRGERAATPEQWLRQPPRAAPPALEMSVPGEEGQGQGIRRRRKGKGAGAARQKARPGCPAPGAARSAKPPPMN